MQTAEVTVAGYFLLLSFFTLLGYVFKKLRVSPVPMMFAILLGNKLVWSIIQVKEIYL
jgi:TctA family transporter